MEKQTQSTERRRRMNNITEWLKSITQEQFREFFSINIGKCYNCPAKDFCKAELEDRCCEEEFYQWAMEEGDDND